MINGGQSASGPPGSRRYVNSRSGRSPSPADSAWPLPNGYGSAPPSSNSTSTSTPHRNFSQNGRYPPTTSKSSARNLTPPSQPYPYHQYHQHTPDTQRTNSPLRSHSSRGKLYHPPSREDRRAPAPPPPKLAVYQDLVHDPAKRSKSLKVKPTRSNPALQENFVFPRIHEEPIPSNNVVDRPSPTRARSASATSTMTTMNQFTSPRSLESNVNAGIPAERDRQNRTPRNNDSLHPAYRAQSQATTLSSSTRDGLDDSIPGSIRSARTTGSSAADLSSTERSSTVTDRSSSSDLTSRKFSWQKVRQDSPDPESDYADLISMYGDGFASDSAEVSEDHAKAPPLPASPLSKHAEPRLKTAGDEKPVKLSVTQTVIPKPWGSKPMGPSHARTSTQIIAGQLDFSSFREEAAKPVENELRDRYGFKKQSQHVSLARYDTWNIQYSDYLARRRQKWMMFLKQSGLAQVNPKEFPPKSDKTKRYVRKGIPPEWRGAAWFWYAGGHEQLAENRGLYDKLVQRAENGQISDGDKEHIERDLHRTFPDNVLFKPDPNPIDLRHAKPPRPLSTSTQSSSSAPETPMVQSLRRVLRAFAVHNPKIGYCQSLNFLAGTLLLFLQGDEEKAFHLLLIITTIHLPGTHGVALEGANVDIGVLMTALKDSMPAVWAKVDDRDAPALKVSRGDMRVATGLPTVSLATTAWFMSAFVSTLPVETAARAWDVLFYEGSKTLFRVALAIFKLGERQIRAANDPMEVFQVVQTLPRGLIDANEVMEVALRKGRGGVGGLSQKTVEKRREERRGMYKVERERALAATPVPPDAEAEAQTGLDRKLSRSSSRARLKRMVSKRITREGSKRVGSAESKPVADKPGA